MDRHCKLAILESTTNDVCSAFRTGYTFYVLSIKSINVTVIVRTAQKFLASNFALQCKIYLLNII